MDVTLTQLQPGVEDGGTPTEVVAGFEWKGKQENQENRRKQKKTENIKKKEGLEYPGEGAAIISAAGPFFFWCFHA